MDRINIIGARTNEFKNHINTIMSPKLEGYDVCVENRKSLNLNIDKDGNIKVVSFNKGPYENDVVAYTWYKGCDDYPKSGSKWGCMKVYYSEYQSFLRDSKLAEVFDEEFKIINCPNAKVVANYMPSIGDRVTIHSTKGLLTTEVLKATKGQLTLYKPGYINLIARLDLDGNWICRGYKVSF